MRYRTKKERKRLWDNLMNYDEMKKLWEEMMQADVTKISYSTSANPKNIANNYMGTSPVQQMANNYYQHYRNLSPTDTDAKGLYPYQEPERDEQGTYYGYKILHKCMDNTCTRFISPRYPRHWSSSGELMADLVPSSDRRNMHGIHCTKRPDHPELRNYLGTFHGYSLGMEQWESWVLVKCALFGTVVETEQGFRAEHAQIIGVCDRNGNWQSYQDYQERAQANSRRIAQEEIEWKWHYYGDWSQASSYYDPSADS